MITSFEVAEYAFAFSLIFVIAKTKKTNKTKTNKQQKKNCPLSSRQGG